MAHQHAAARSLSPRRETEVDRRLKTAPNTWASFKVCFVVDGSADKFTPKAAFGSGHRLLERPKITESGVTVSQPDCCYLHFAASRPRAHVQTLSTNTRRGRRTHARMHALRQPHRCVWKCIVPAVGILSFPLNQIRRKVSRN